MNTHHKAPKLFPVEFENPLNCYEALRSARPEDFTCCQMRANYDVKTGVWRCTNRECRRRTSVARGTIFQGCSDIVKYFRAIWIFCTAKQGCTARDLQAQLQLSYSTAHDWLRQIRMVLRPVGLLEGETQLEIVSVQSQLILIALRAIDTIYYEVRFALPENEEPDSVASTVKTIIAQTSLINTSAWPGFEKLGAAGFQHHRAVAIEAVEVSHCSW